MPAAMENPYGIYELGGNGDSQVRYCSSVPLVQDAGVDMNMLEPAFVKRRRLV